jgi:cellulose synthase/poly-beta-1,6-N-acetylglucosamine synthase-like glycosyltransferase
MTPGERAPQPWERPSRPSSGRPEGVEPRHLEFDRVRRRLVPCPELDCLRHCFAPGTLAAAELRAAEIGTGADRVLIAAGTICEDEYIALLAASLGVPFDRLDRIEWQDCWWDEDRVLDAAGDGVLALRIRGQDILVIAPQAFGARQTIAFLARHPQAAARLRLTTRACLERFIAWYTPDGVGSRAAYAMKSAAPHFSAALSGSRALLATMICTIAVGMVAMPAVVRHAAEAMLAFVFLGWTGLRLLGLLTAGIVWRRNVRLKEDRLPVYTVIVALYRETAALPGLVESLSALDYPAEKLEIKLVIEPDDVDMRTALDAMPLDPRFHVIVAPATGPRTKPKALNAALPFSRGHFIAVYDAEDRPEPDQLRRALVAFATGGEALACVQARLTIDNARDSFISRLFTAEYAGLFDVFLPGIAAWRLPLPLGGSSNHFRAEALHHVGAWDPYNVTEDADLGMRLARYGYRAGMIDSVTYEEAPIRFLPWLKQRTRWFKGWMQTWFVHMRHPLDLLNELGLPGFIVFQLVVGGTVLAALVHSVFAGIVVWQFATRDATAASADLSKVLVDGLHSTTLISGYLMSAILGVIGLARRRLLDCAWVLLLTPLYWIMLSIAAWRALFQLVYDPYRWEKTEHGHARTSRLAQRAVARKHRVPW